MSRLSAGIWAAAGGGFGALLGGFAGVEYGNLNSGYSGPPSQKDIERGQTGAVIGGLIGAALGAALGTDSERTLREQVCPQLQNPTGTVHGLGEPRWP